MDDSAKNLKQHELTFDPTDGLWRVRKHSEVVEVKKITGKLKRQYLQEDFQKIFQDFQPEKDTVAWRPRYDPEYLILRRRTKVRPTSTLDNGLYRFTKDNCEEMCLESIQLPSEEEYVERGYSDDILAELRTFFSARQKYESLSVKHKRGNLLHGPPGTGKTYSIIRAIRECMEQFDLLVFLISRKFYGFSKLQKFNERFSHRNTVFLLEEVTSHVEMTGASLLSYLDGELSWNHHFTFATTNNPERLQANLVNRPGRFDRVIKFPLPDADFRRRFLEGHMDEEAITQEVIERTEGFNISYLKELVLRVDVYDTDVETILDEFKEQKRMVENSFKESDDMVGFL